MPWVFLHRSLTRTGVGRAAGECSGLGCGVWGCCLPGWVGGDLSREVEARARALLFPGPSSRCWSGLLPPWRLETLTPPEPLPRGARVRPGGGTGVRRLPLSNAGAWR